MHSRDFDSRAKTDSALSRQLAEGRQKRTEHPLLWLQRQFGNRFVQRALTLSRKADSTEVSPMCRYIPISRPTRSTAH
jgi:hypothetical protein